MPRRVNSADVPKKTPSSEIDKLAGLRLRALREAMDWAQEPFAKSIGATRTQLANWEGGKMPDPRAIVRLFERHGISSEWVLSGLLRNLPYDVARKLEQVAPDLARSSSHFQAEPLPARLGSPRRHRSAKTAKLDNPDSNDQRQPGKLEAEAIAEILP